MPLYDYRCHKCGEVFEVRQRFSDELLRVHEECGGALERLISAPALQFKGTGWYVTDYGRNGKVPSTTGGNGSESKTDTKTDTKKDTKSEAKPAPAAASKDKSSKDK